jgi:acetyl-CoA synthetase
MAGAWDLKPGSATLPFFGVQPVLLDQEGREKDGATEGNLCIKAPWPGEW